MNMEMFIQHLFNALALGALYGLIAIGYTMVYGILRLINFAHGDIFMMGAYLVFFTTVAFMPVWVAVLLMALAILVFYSTFYGFEKFPPVWVMLSLGTLTALGIYVSVTGPGEFAPPWAFAVFFAIAVTSAIGIMVDRVAYRPLREAPRISALISAIGISFLIENLGVVIFTGLPRPVVQPEALVTPLTFSIPLWMGEPLCLLILVLSLLLFMGLLFFVVYKTLRCICSFTGSSFPIKKVPASGAVEAETHNPVFLFLCCAFVCLIMWGLVRMGVSVFIDLLPGETGSLVRVAPIALIVPFVSIVLILGLLWILYRTKPGLAMRSISKDIETTRLMGVSVNKIIALTFGLGSALAAAAGIMWALRYPQIHPYMGVLPGFKAFIAAVFGGIGSIQGAMIGGLMLGFIEILVVAFFPSLSGYRDAFAFILLIAILLWKPTGLMGEKLEEKI